MHENPTNISINKDEIIANKSVGNIKRRTEETI